MKSSDSPLASNCLSSNLSFCIFSSATLVKLLSLFELRFPHLQHGGKHTNVQFQKALKTQKFPYIGSVLILWQETAFISISAIFLCFLAELFVAG